MNFYQEFSFEIFDYLPLYKLYKLTIYINDVSEFQIQFSNRRLVVIINNEES